MKMPTSEDYDEIADAALRMLTVKRLRAADIDRLVEISGTDDADQISEIQQAAVSLYQALQDGDIARVREHWLDLGVLCLLRAEVALHEERQAAHMRAASKKNWWVG